MRRLIVIGALAGLMALAAASATPAAAKPPGANGQIVFVRFDPLLPSSLEEPLFIYTVNPDGSHEHLVGEGDCPRWSPDGTRIAICGGSGIAHIVDPDTGGFRVLSNPDPNLELHCPFSWSPDGQRLACEGFGETDPSLTGIYTVRSSDGSGLTRVTSNPGGDDIPGDHSPNGKRLVFGRVGPPTDPAALGLYVVRLTALGLYVVRLSDNRLRQIVPAGLLSSFGDWSPQGNEIVFSQHVTPDARSSLWVVHADGSGLHEIPVQAQPACGGASADPSSQGCFGPRWSPDGNKIVFTRGTSAGHDSNIYTVNADGTDLTQVTHGGTDQSPDWGTHPLSG